MKQKTIFSNYLLSKIYIFFYNEKKVWEIPSSFGKIVLLENTEYFSNSALKSYFICNTG